MAENYQRWLDEELRRLTEENKVPRLLLHSCCAPCSSYVLEYLSDYFAITVLYYNPNIIPQEEFERRLSEQRRLIEQLPHRHPITLMDTAYESESFLAIAAGHESDPEGGERCERCYRLRLTKAAEIARDGGYDYFTTTLSVSPLKNAAMLCAIGKELAQEYGVNYLYSDFKKREGYKRSCQLSAQYRLYRQNYCGCPFSKQESQQRKNGITP